MPTSKPRGTEFVCNKIIELKPKSVLDVGIGFGRYGFLAREFVELWVYRDYFKREGRIDGIEAFEPYIKDWHKTIYDNIYIGDVLDVIDTLDHYDLIICGDMLEHLVKERGIILLTKIKSHCKNSITILPVKVLKQGAGYGNEYERHLSQWSVKELSKFGKVVEQNGGYIVFN